MREGMGSYSVLATNTPDKLIAGPEIPILVEGVTIKTGQGILARGSVIGIETATGKGILCDSAAVDGSEVARYILAEEEIDTSSGDVVATCYKSGIFNRQALIFGTNGAPATLDTDLRSVNIHLRDEVPY
jgi:hypothetical protein